jgi:hypothetical protein
LLGVKDSKNGDIGFLRPLASLVQARPNFGVVVALPGPKEVPDRTQDDKADLNSGVLLKRLGAGNQRADVARQIEWTITEGNAATGLP